MKSTDLIREWAEVTSFHGIPNIARSKFIVSKIIWLFVFAIALAFSIFSIITQFVDYYSRSVLTTIEMTEDSMITFPAVTLCNLNPFSTFEAIEFVKKSPLNLSQAANLDGANYLDASVGLSYAKRAELQGSNVSESLRKSMGLDLDSFMLLCIYNGRACNLSKDFEWIYNSEFGNCFTFGNANGNKQVFKEGKDNGLVVSMFVGVPNSLYSLALFSGASVFVHAPSSKPVRGKGIEIAPGIANYIHIDKEVYQRFILLVY